jgi:hypothetical protein
MVREIRDIPPLQEKCVFESQVCLNQLVKFNDGEKDNLTASVEAIKFAINGKVFYDLAVWVGKGGNDETIIRDVDSIFVKST